jgi:hypothetical protein
MSDDWINSRERAVDYERPLFEAVRVLVEVEEHEKGTQATQ